MNYDNATCRNEARVQGERAGALAGDQARLEDQERLGMWEAGFRRAFFLAAGRAPTEAEVEANRPANEAAGAGL